MRCANSTASRLRVHERVAAPYADALVSGDVMHSAIQGHRPERNSAFCADADRARESRLQLLNRAADTHATVFAAHFARTSAGNVTRSGDGFEWRDVEPQGR
jgi:glyoxylase-like metal-dependent hydrolase (beta-lactamase superfamily II)